jgi:hypothetical protein
MQIIAKTIILLVMTFFSQLKKLPKDGVFVDFRFSTVTMWIWVTSLKLNYSYGLAPKMGQTQQEMCVYTIKNEASKLSSDTALE